MRILIEISQQTKNEYKLYYSPKMGKTPPISSGTTKKNYTNPPETTD